MNIVHCIGAYNKIVGYDMAELYRMLENRECRLIKDVIVLEDQFSTPIKCIKHYYYMPDDTDMSKEKDTPRVCYSVRQKMSEANRAFMSMDNNQCRDCHMCALKLLEEKSIKRNMNAIKKKALKMRSKNKKRLIL